MTKTLKDLRPVYVVGVGWHRYQPLSETSYVTLALKAIRDVSIHGIRGVNHDISKRYALIVAKFLQ